MKVIDGGGSAATLRFAVIQSLFNDAVDVICVPGAFEIPLVAAQLAKTRRYDALVCLGAVIRGETPHFEYVSAVVSQGIARVSYEYGVPVIFGVLTTDTEAQAEARSSGGSNKGSEAGRAAIEMANLMNRLPRRRPSSTRRQQNSRQSHPRRRLS